MKMQFVSFKGKVNLWNLFIGLVLGFGIGVSTLSALVPDADDMKRVYKLKEDQANRILHGNHNAYMMEDVTSEKRFLEEMVKHHEAAVMMSEQVLLLSPSDRVKDLAYDIISAQMSEIGAMKKWLAESE